MKNSYNSKMLKIISIAVFFIAFFLYFFIYNRYHLSYLEQNQLFRYNLGYLSELLQKPGGIIAIIGGFVTQFFTISWVAAILLSLFGFLIFLLSQSINRFYKLNGVLFSLLPVVFLASLHSNHNYLVTCTIGLVIFLADFTYYIKIRNRWARYLFGILSFVILYFVAGIFSMMAMMLFIVHELLYEKEKNRIYFVLTAIVLSIFLPQFASKYIYLVDLKTAWLLPVSPISMASNSLFLLIMTVYYPLIIIVVLLYYGISKQSSVSFKWNLRHLVPGSVILLMAVFMMLKFAYDPRNELFLKIDNNYHNSKWDKVLTLSKHYPGSNQLVMYYTNLALYKSGKLPDVMFDFQQSGTSGLWIDWKRNETAPFFGGEIYYNLGYNNEAFRWAFEAMEVKGLNPRSLKRLVLTSIINRDYNIAGKFLNYLDQSLFYRNWANHYRILLKDTTQIYRYPEIVEKRKLFVKEDFIAGVNSQVYELYQLLKNHPNNRMAFEYLMMSFLLNKDMESFAANIYRLEELGYQKIPRHFEEAIILYSGIAKKNILPEGLMISAATQKRFHDYATLFASNRYSMKKSAEVLHNDFGNTFWYYMQFMNGDAISK